ncbi:transposase [Streptomyces sp. H10-C2]|uniref:transposase n=1 Tax=unclassified Streptomyces TaxID=2593676 RepID=UPI0024BBAD8F|nr:MULTISPECIES: transposase [unclassified Streptomyces]MDJ0347361.1 transposase [Streptomyces sp. PH10-H1]MDJ0375571.1 transposase [Streptomyces sp. H10-C2]
MARPSKFSPEFRSDAIALWRASAGRRTYRDVATDLNVNPETLRVWVRDVDGPPADGGKVTPGDAEAEPARLRAETARLLKAEKEWQREREILRRAAAYFAKEMK